MQSRSCERSQHPSFDTVLIVLGVEVVSVGGIELTQPVSQDLDLFTRLFPPGLLGSAGGLW